MQLVVLGSGTTVPHPKRSSSGFWMESGKSRILLDCSASVPLRMAQEGVNWPELDAIWISHFHLDHCAGLPAFLAGSKHAEEMRGRKKPLRIFGGKGLRTLINRFNSVHDYRLLEQPFPVEVIEIEALNEFEIAPGLTAAAMSTKHTAESHALHLRDAHGVTLVYSADTSFDEVLATFARGVDLFILECAFVKNKPIKTHLELAEAVYLIRRSHAKQAMLTHFYPEWDALDFDEEVEKLLAGRVILQAADGMRVDL